MNLKDVAKDLTDQTNYRIEQRLAQMMRTNPSFKNLDSGNRDLIMDLIKKYKDKARRGVKTSAYTVREDMYRLYKKRLKLKLSYQDLDQIRDLLNSFKSS
ncbi:MAG: hypothetical protein WC146_01360 [Patescibacteria group bacterium]|jgi:hypothetical protein